MYVVSREKIMKLKTISHKDVLYVGMYLIDTESVEREFQRVVNWHKDAFWDEKSIEFMNVIDHAKRQGDYGVVTPIGESCITCLSTGCKFGLLVLYYTAPNFNVKLIVDYYVAGENVWEWLTSNLDATLYIFQENLCVSLTNHKNLNIEHDGVLYEVGDDFEALDMIIDCEAIPYTMTKESEAQAYEEYERHSKYNKDVYFNCVVEEMLIDDFVQYFSDFEYYLENINVDEQLRRKVDGYNIDVYCNYLPQELPCRRHPIYICGEKKNGQIVSSKVNSVKYPTFLELFFYDVWDGGYYKEQERRAFHEEYVRWFALVLDGDERCLIRNYPKETLFGIEVDKKCAYITIYDSATAIKKFHELYQKSVPSES